VSKAAVGEYRKPLKSAAECWKHHGMGNAVAVLVILVFYGASVVVALAIGIYVLRRGVEPLRAELARIADVMELRADLDLADDDPSV
jgi:hypothetical protein